MEIRSLAACLALVALLPSAVPAAGTADVYYGQRIVDPYRDMESGGPAYEQWKAGQVAATQRMLAAARKHGGFAQAAGVTPPHYTDLTLAAGRIFYETHDAGGDTLWVRDAHGGTPRTLLSDTSSTTKRLGYLGAFAVSNDGTKIAIHTYAGKSIADIHILDAADGHDLEAPLHDTIYDYIGFTPDGSALTYAKASIVTSEMAVPDVSYDYLHVLGTAQTADLVIFGHDVSPLVDVPPHTFAFVDASDGEQAVAEVRDVGAGGSRFYTAPAETLGKPGTPWRALGTAADGYTDLAVHGTTIDLITSAAAPNYAVVRASLVGPFEPRVVLAASATAVVSGTLDGIPKAGIFALNAAADADYVQLLERGVARMVRIPYVEKPTPASVALPLDGSILETAVDSHAPGILLHMTNWITRGDIFRVEPASDAAEALHIVDAATATATPRVAEEFTVLARDGTAIPVSVVHGPGISLDGSHPLILQVTGAYGFSLTPDYRSVPEAWLERGGIYAVAHVRGGGELGEAWHRAGMGEHKSNTWWDLIAAAQGLIDKGYTSSERLNLLGTTQSYLGGLAASVAIGRAIEERPELFAAAVVDQPVFDLLRSERTALGKQSVSEFGSVATREGFEALRAMSPYEHVRAHRRYPRLLIRTYAAVGAGDDWQGAKMVARLQAATGRRDAAYLDAVHDTDADSRTRADLLNDALAFFLYMDR
jgi:prolyl oligopeptidase